MRIAGFAAAVVACLAFHCETPAFAQGTPSGMELRRATLAGEAPLSLRRSVELALESNPQLVVERLRVEQARAGIDVERGFYDPVFDLSSRVGRRDNVVASRFFPSGQYVEKDTVYEARLNGLTQMGSRYGMGLNFHRQLSTSNTQSLSPQFSARLDLTFSQPLLRDFGREVVLTRLRIAQRDHEISEENLATGVSTLVFEVVQAYWNLVFLREDLETRRTSLALAEALLEQIETLLRAGQVTEGDVHQARAAVFERREDAIRFENEVERAEDRLKVLLYADLPTVTLIPGDVLEDGPTDLDQQRSFEHALGRKPELARVRKEIEQRGHETTFASNQTRPRLDLNLEYGMSGVSGQPNQTPVDPNSPLQGRAGDTVPGSVFADITRPLGAFDGFFPGTGSTTGAWNCDLNSHSGIGRPKPGLRMPTCVCVRVKRHY